MSVVRFALKTSAVGQKTVFRIVRLIAGLFMFGIIKKFLEE